MSDLLDDARSYLSAQFGGNDMTGIPESAVRHAIDSLYQGGWLAYQADYQRFHSTQRTVLEELSPIKRKLKTEQWVGFKLRPYDEIVRAEFSETEVTIVLSKAEVEYGSRRDIVKSRTLTLYKWTRSAATEGWQHQSIDVTDRAEETHHRWGAINTTDRHNDKLDQYETCYRPGTHKSPLQGWVVRADMSWDEAHGDEEFQKPTQQ